MKGSGLRGDAKMNDTKETGNILVLQSMQQPIRSELCVVGPYLPKPIRDLPHPILLKLRVRKIVYDLEPVWNGIRLDITDGAAKLADYCTFEMKSTSPTIHWSKKSCVSFQTIKYAVSDVRVDGGVRMLHCKDRILPPEDDKHRVLVYCGRHNVLVVLDSDESWSGGGQRVMKHAGGDGGSIGKHVTEPDFVLSQVSSSGLQTLRSEQNDVGRRMTMDMSGMAFRPHVQVTSDIDVRRRIVVSQSTGCRSEEGLKETEAMEKTVTRMRCPFEYEKAAPLGVYESGDTIKEAIRSPLLGTKQGQPEVRKPSAPKNEGLLIFMSQVDSESFKKDNVPGTKTWAYVRTGGSAKMRDRWQKENKELYFNIRGKAEDKTKGP
ncbi:hypothetical protein EDD85DRAFT_975193 [Armillaria nabsnona]|nr:hypothetical protein EDD85DRAFT_975193 [Armillaria nabsnona]